MSSTTVTKRSENTKTPATVAATTGHRSFGLAGLAGVASTGVSDSTAPAAWAALVTTASSCSAESGAGSEWVTPAALVPPKRRNNFALSGTRTTTCLTALLVRSIDWKTKAVPVVAAMEPMATPTMVPFTPKIEAMTADSTAPAAEARIWR
jgi:hypothetical protein